MHAFGIESFAVRQREQTGEHVATNLGGPGLPRDTKAVSAARDLDIEAAFDLPQVFIKLTAQVGEAVVIGGLENNVPRNLDSTQNRYLEPLCR
jgi:hypothetical protein